MVKTFSDYSVDAQRYAREQAERKASGQRITFYDKPDEYKLAYNQLLFEDGDIRRATESADESKIRYVDYQREQYSEQQQTNNTSQYLQTTKDGIRDTRTGEIVAPVGTSPQQAVELARGRYEDRQEQQQATENFNNMLFENQMSIKPEQDSRGYVTQFKVSNDEPFAWLTQKLAEKSAAADTRAARENTFSSNIISYGYGFAQFPLGFAKAIVTPIETTKDVGKGLIYGVPAIIGLAASGEGMPSISKSLTQNPSKAFGKLTGELTLGYGIAKGVTSFGKRAKDLRALQKLEKAEPELSIGLEKETGDFSRLLIASIRKTNNVQSKTLFRFDVLKTGEKTYQVVGGKGGQRITRDSLLFRDNPINERLFTAFGKAQEVPIKVRKSLGNVDALIDVTKQKGILSEIQILTKPNSKFVRNYRLIEDSKGRFRNIKVEKKEIVETPELIKTRGLAIQENFKDFTKLVSFPIEKFIKLKTGEFKLIDLATGKQKMVNVYDDNIKGLARLSKLKSIGVIRKIKESTSEVKSVVSVKSTKTLKVLKEEKFGGNKFYHGTMQKNQEKILKQGLKQGNLRGGIDKTKVSFLTDSKELAKTFSKDSDNILEISLTKKQLSKVESFGLQESKGIMSEIITVPFKVPAKQIKKINTKQPLQILKTNPEKTKKVGTASALEVEQKLISSAKTNLKPTITTSKPIGITQMSRTVQSEPISVTTTPASIQKLPSITKVQTPIISSVSIQDSFTRIKSVPKIKQADLMRFNVGVKSAVETTTATDTISKSAFKQASTGRLKTSNLQKYTQIKTTPKIAVPNLRFPTPKIPVPKIPRFDTNLKTSYKTTTKKKKRYGIDYQVIPQGFTSKALNLKKLRLI